LSAQTGSDNYQQLVQAYVGTTTYEYPETAARWAVTLANNEARRGAMKNVGRAWLQIDRASAERWIQGSNLPDEDKQALLKQGRP